MLQVLVRQGVELFKRKLYELRVAPNILSTGLWLSFVSSGVQSKRAATASTTLFWVPGAQPKIEAPILNRSPARVRTACDYGCLKPSLR